MRLLSLALLRPVRQWLDRGSIPNPLVARFLCKVIPVQCPSLARHQTLRSPGAAPSRFCASSIRFTSNWLPFDARALCYLVDECGADIQAFS